MPEVVGCFNAKFCAIHISNRHGFLRSDLTHSRRNHTSTLQECEAVPGLCPHGFGEV